MVEKNVSVDGLVLPSEATRRSLMLRLALLLFLLTLIVFSALVAADVDRLNLTGPPVKVLRIYQGDWADNSLKKVNGLTPSGDLIHEDNGRFADIPITDQKNVVETETNHEYFVDYLDTELVDALNVEFGQFHPTIPVAHDALLSNSASQFRYSSKQATGVGAVSGRVKTNGATSTSASGLPEGSEKGQKIDWSKRLFEKRERRFKSRRKLYYE